MRNIQNSISLKKMLKNTKYSIHYYQREYMWQRKQIEELIDDLTSEFFNNYHDGDPREKVRDYGAYFMGSIVLAGRQNAIIDGQQRLTSLTLLLIYLNNRLKENNIKSSLEDMIYSEAYGKESFNIDVDDRQKCMQAIFNNKEFDTANEGESVCNLYGRYKDIKELFPTDDIGEKVLPYFCDWLVDKVCFMEIIADTDQDAHKIFVSLNDRGLNLTSTEMLKGFILSEISDDKKRQELSNSWKKNVQKLKMYDEKEDDTFYKAWLRAHYAETIRETKAGAELLDFDIIGGAFHKWVRENKEKLNLSTSKDYENFIAKFEKFTDIYLRIRNAENTFSEELKYVFYNAKVGFTQQILMLLAPINYDDSKDTITEKINLVARFVEYWIVSRVTRGKSMNYDEAKRTVFKYAKELRHLPIPELKTKLNQYITDLGYKPEEAIPNFKLNSSVKKYIKHMLARITSYIEEQTDIADSNYSKYMVGPKSNPFEIEHIITDHFEWFKNEYSDENDFNAWRDNIGSLLLLPKSINASLSDLLYNEKLTTYCSSQGNIYAATLGEVTYEHYPRFCNFNEQYHIGFEPCSHFGKEEIKKRNMSIIKLAKLIWNDKMFET